LVGSVLSLHIHVLIELRAKLMPPVYRWVRPVFSAETESIDSALCSRMGRKQ